MESVGILFATLLVIAQPALADDKGYVTGSLKKVQAQEQKSDVLPQVLIMMEPAITTLLALIHANSKLDRWVAERQFNITGG
jgi:hypothetical protein